MQKPATNPFTHTRAADFDDQQIHDYWVDFPDGSLVSLANPSSTMPMIVLGGKGSGKTHLLRYFSYPLQKIRHLAHVGNGIAQERYLGVYLRCGGLNSSRFRNKGQSPDVWSAVYAYYLEIWLAQLLIGIIADAVSSSPGSSIDEAATAADIIGLFDVPIPGRFSSLADVVQLFGSKQRELDYQVNNCAISGALRFEILASPGRLVFGIPTILARRLDFLANATFLYMIDEYENLLEYQQRHINTLLREKVSPSTIKIGSKLYGLRTFKTNSADEENREGSEFEMLRLDARMRSMTQYSRFAKKLVAKRLIDHHRVRSNDQAQADALEQTLEAWFDEPPKDRFARHLTSFVAQNYRDKERPYFRALRKKLRLGSHYGKAPGIRSSSDISQVVQNLAYPDVPLLEKVNCYLLYKRWAGSKDLVADSQDVATNLAAYLADRPNDGTHREAMSKFRADLLAQLLRECKHRQIYAGIRMFVDMSAGFPRNLLVILKNVYSWAVFNGRDPFVSEAIPLPDQSAGVRDAVEWFFRDSQSTGRERAALKDAINRLGTLFRGIRFSDKPSECSLTTFSFDMATVSASARDMIDLAQQWSLLIDVGDQRDRNEGRLDFKLQLNPMLAPRWDLAIYQRGVIVLSPEELDAIFCPADQNQFKRVLRTRISRMRAPFFGDLPRPIARRPQREPMLPGFEEAATEPQPKDASREQ